MTVYERIRILAQEKKMSIAELERTLNLSNGIISKWNKVNPNSGPLSKVADYFNVSTDYLLGRSDAPNRTSSSNDAIGQELITHFRLNTANMAIEDATELESELNEYMDFLIQKARAKQQKQK